MWDTTGDRKTANNMDGPLQGRGHGTTVLPPLDIQHAWFELTRTRPWRSAAMVPVTDAYTTLHLSQDLALMASLDPHNKVLLVNATGALSQDLLSQSHSIEVAGKSMLQVANGRYTLFDCAKLGLDETTVGMVEIPKLAEQIKSQQSPFNLLLVATNSVLLQPAAVSIARCMDATVLCVPLGQTSFNAAERSLELIGPENVVGSIAVRMQRP